MPLLESEEIVQAPSGYKFSMPNMEDLEDACEYTMAGFCTDVSGSVASFKTALENALKALRDGCLKSPRADNLLLRTTQFAESVDEIHGFRILGDIADDEYKGCLRIGGMTSLRDAAYEMIEAVATAGEVLAKQRYAVNGIVFVLTDGQDNNSRKSVQALAQLRERVQNDEYLESLLVLLVGVGVDSQYLEDLKRDAKFDEYINMKDLTGKSLAHLMGWASSMVSSQSQALNSGGPSKVLTF